MTTKTAFPSLKGGVARRTFLHGSLGAVVAGSAGLILPRRVRAADSGLVALVHTQAAGDNGPVDSMIAALKKLSGEKGFPIRTIYAQDPATYESIFRSLGDAGAAVIATTFNEVAEPIKALAPGFPKTRWIQIFGDPFDPPIPNVVTVSYDYYLGCYLSGLFAAKVSKTGKIGYIGGVSIPPLNADLNAMKAAICLLDMEIAQMRTDIRQAYRDNPVVMGIFPVAAYNGGPRNVTKLYNVLDRMNVGLDELSRPPEEPVDTPVKCPCVWKADGTDVRPVSIPRYNNENRWYIEKYQSIVSLFE